ncbi:MAG: gfo/Idh/MocA family oxidoreductase, partial [Flavobacteriales bacterium]
MGDRRKFIKNLGVASVATTLPFGAIAATQKKEREKTLKVGLIGVHGMGWADLNSFLKNPGTEC